VKGIERRGGGEAKSSGPHPVRAFACLSVYVWVKSDACGAMQTFLGSSKLLTLTATLDSDIFAVGQPITVQYDASRHAQHTHRHTHTHTQ
jgi:hypothetical protein